MLNSKKRRTRRYFSRDYKRQIVEMMRQQHISPVAISKDLDLSHRLVRRWEVEFDAEEKKAVSDTGKLIVSDAERVQEFEKRLHQLQIDNDLLKRATALFAREMSAVVSTGQ